MYTSLQYQVTDDDVSDEVDVSRVAELVAEGQITDETLVWTEGMETWTEFGECRHLFAGLAEADADAEDCLLYTSPSPRDA